MTRRIYNVEEILNLIDNHKKEFNDYPVFMSISENKEYRLIGANNEHAIFTSDGFEFRMVELKDGLPCGVEVTKEEEEKE